MTSTNDVHMLSALERFVRSARLGEVRIHRVDVERDRIETTNGGPWRTFEPARTSTITFHVEHLK